MFVSTVVYAALSSSSVKKNHRHFSRVWFDYRDCPGARGSSKPIWEITTFSKTLFLTMLYTINSSPLLFTNNVLMLTVILSNSSFKSRGKNITKLFLFVFQYVWNQDVSTSPQGSDCVGLGPWLIEQRWHYRRDGHRSGESVPDQVPSQLWTSKHIRSVRRFPLCLL